mmetsp:Transcript_41200/g.101350  ORF Transcript_41200/g.101350 Transcript_41200/m.101350 type:complete len:138 (+) Transcript_41200:111-524(+)
MPPHHHITPPPRAHRPGPRSPAATSPRRLALRKAPPPTEPTPAGISPLSVVVDEQQQPSHSACPPPPITPADVEGVDDLLADETEEVCPTCLEEYHDDNPKIVANCGHTFHLACIYEWLERNPHCPICAKRMRFKEK